jgi:hypothetical protein
LTQPINTPPLGVFPQSTDPAVFNTTTGLYDSGGSAWSQEQIVDRILRLEQGLFGPLALLATTGAAGFAKQNGTPNILSWTAPNDGQLHRVQLLYTKNVTSSETGGAAAVSFVNPSQAAVANVDAGNQAAGWTPGAPAGGVTFMMQPGQTITLAQTTALTAGASKVYAELWGS